LKTIAKKLYSSRRESQKAQAIMELRHKFDLNTFKSNQYGTK
jgi:hypothetical protein